MLTAVITHGKNPRVTEKCEVMSLPDSSCDPQSQLCNQPSFKMFFLGVEYQLKRFMFITARDCHGYVSSFTPSLLSFLPFCYFFFLDRDLPMFPWLETPGQKQLLFLSLPQQLGPLQAPSAASMAVVWVLHATVISSKIKDTLKAFSSAVYLQPTFPCVLFSRVCVS